LSEKLADWFSSRRSSVILDLIQQHVAKIEDTVTELDNALQSAKNGKKEETVQTIKRLNQEEEEADRIRISTIEELAKGELKAKEREDLLHLLRRVDIVADWAKDAAWNLEVLVEYNIKIPNEIWSMLVKIGSQLVKETKAMRKSIVYLRTDLDKALEAVKEVEELEHAIDIEYHDTKKLFISHASDLEAPSFMILRDVLKDLEQVADFCEDAEDMVRSIAIRLRGPP
jgi:predicted phosphate transport protein (TIGR00153 family)